MNDLGGDSHSRNSSLKRLQDNRVGTNNHAVTDGYWSQNSGPGSYADIMTNLGFAVFFGSADGVAAK